MKTVLAAINAKYIHSGLGVYSLKANTGKFLSSVFIKEFTINHRVEDILGELYFEKPDILAFSAYVWNIEYIKILSVELHKLLPQIKIWLGGPEVSFNAEDILKECREIKGVMIGEGERTFFELLSFYEENSIRMEEIAGVIYRSETGSIIENRKRDLMNLNQLSFAYGSMKDFENRILYYESSRGCPFFCSYCLSSVEKKLRFKDFDIVEKELAFFLENKVKQVKFVDRTFNCKPDHAVLIWKFLLEHDNGITNFHFEISADLLNQEQIALLRRMRKGLVQFEIGVQTTNPLTIEAIERKMDLEKLKDSVRQINDSGNIHQHLDLIAGLPYEDYESFGRSFNEVYELRPEQLQLGFLKVLYGAKMHEKAVEYGLAYMSRPPYEVLFSKWMSYEEISRLKKIEEAVEIYYNSGQFTNTLKCLERVFQSPFLLYEQLAEFLFEEDRFLKHSRMNYYYLLLAFSLRVDNKNEEVYKELLTFDLYLRENMKSRPEFAGDMTVHKERRKAFYKNEEKQPLYLQGYEKYSAKQMANMTHIEIFKRNILNYMENGADTDTMQETGILFDYLHRDELTNSAKIVVVPI